MIKLKCPLFNFIREKEDKFIFKINVYPVLNVGKQNALTAKEIANLLGIDERAVTRQIRKEREQGYLICSSKDLNGGFFLPENKAEAEEFVRRIERECKSFYSLYITLKNRYFEYYRENEKPLTAGEQLRDQISFDL